MQDFDKFLSTRFDDFNRSTNLGPVYVNQCYSSMCSESIAYDIVTVIEPMHAGVREAEVSDINANLPTPT